MKLKLLLLTLSLYSCGSGLCDNAEFVTKQGICVNTDGNSVDKSQVDFIIDVIEEGTVKYSGYSESELQEPYGDTRIAFRQEIDHGWTGETEYHKGIFVNDEYKVRLVYNECLTYSALYHELLHVYLIHLEGNDTHERGWFKKADMSSDEIKQTLEYNLFRRIYCELCPGPQPNFPICD